MFSWDGDTVLGSLGDERVNSALDFELVDDVCEPDAFFALGVSVVKQSGRSAHSASSKRGACFLARGAKRAGFGAVGGTLCKESVIGAQSFAAVRDASAAPWDGQTLFLDWFCELGGFFFGLFCELGGFLGGFLGEFGGFLFGFLGEFGGFFFGFPFNPTGFFGSFSFNLLGGVTSFALFVGESDFGGFGLLFFGFLGGFDLLDGVSFLVKFDSLRGLGGLQGLGLLSRTGGTFLEFELQGRGFELSDDETTDRFAIEILTFAREHGNDDVDEFVADLGSHVVRHFREALFHDWVRGKSHVGSSLGISGVHCFVVDVVF